MILYRYVNMNAIPETFPLPNGTSKISCLLCLCTLYSDELPPLCLLFFPSIFLLGFTTIVVANEGLEVAIKFIVEKANVNQVPQD